MGYLYPNAIDYVVYILTDCTMQSVRCHSIVEHDRDDWAREHAPDGAVLYHIKSVSSTPGPVRAEHWERVDGQRHVPTRFLSWFAGWVYCDPITMRGVPAGFDLHAAARVVALHNAGTRCPDRFAELGKLLEARHA